VFISGSASTIKCDVLLDWRRIGFFFSSSIFAPEMVLLRDKKLWPFGLLGGSTIAPLTLYLSSLYEILPATLSRQLFIFVLKLEGSCSYALANLFFWTGKLKLSISLFCSRTFLTSKFRSNWDIIFYYILF
jgi:hypothetical protein